MFGCVLNPRNGREIAHTSEKVAFDGYTSLEGGKIEVMAKNHKTGEWKVLVSKAPGTKAAYIEENGTKWYRFDVEATFPAWNPTSTNSTNDFWKTDTSSSARKMKLTTKIRQKWSTDSFIELNTFESDADNCLQQEHADEPFAARAADCKSPNSPNLTLQTKCGKSGQDCCDREGVSGATMCDGASLTCDFASGRCSSCGDVGEICCAGNTCDGRGICSGGKCVSCGATGDRCCGGNSCDSGNVCSGGECVSCGARGDRCCGGNSCDSGLSCQSGTCQVECGGNNEPCCGNSCDGNLVCKSGTCKSEFTQIGTPWVIDCACSNSLNGWAGGLTADFCSAVPFSSLPHHICVAATLNSGVVGLTCNTAVAAVATGGSCEASNAKATFR